MPLSVMYSNGGNSQGHLFKQMRQTKLSDQPLSVSSSDQKAPAQSRPNSRSAIDSTGSGTAQISAALTIYMSKLGESGIADDGVGSRGTSVTTLNPPSAKNAGSGSGAADLLRALDAYAS